MCEHSINIVHIYPDLLNLYGDEGNIACMQKRLTWRGVDVNIIRHTIRSDDFDLGNADIIFIGGGSDREQKIVSDKLLPKKQKLMDYVENGGVLVAVCGGFQLLGHYYKTIDSTMEGLGILDIYTEAGSRRMVGNIVIENNLFDQYIVGFENHAGITCIGSHTPLGSVIYGHGNGWRAGVEGVLYKNVIATYLHGPLLPKNPKLCDYILLKAIQNKAPHVDKLAELDDKIEEMANAYIVRRFIRK